MIYEDIALLGGSPLKELEEIVGETSPWYTQIGKPVILSSIRAPEEQSPLADISFIISLFLENPHNASLRLSDIDAYRRLRDDEAVRYLSSRPDGCRLLRLFEHHIGYQFYKDLTNPHHYLDGP